MADSNKPVRNSLNSNKYYKARGTQSAINHGVMADGRSATRTASPPSITGRRPVAPAHPAAKSHLSSSNKYYANQPAAVSKNKPVQTSTPVVATAAGETNCLTLSGPADLLPVGTAAIKGAVAGKTVKITAISARLGSQINGFLDASIGTKKLTSEQRDRVEVLVVLPGDAAKKINEPFNPPDDVAPKGTFPKLQSTDIPPSAGVVNPQGNTSVSITPFDGAGGVDGVKAAEKSATQIATEPPIDDDEV